MAVQPDARGEGHATGPVEVVIPTGGLSIPNVPGGLFWDPDADGRFLTELRAHLRPDIPIVTAEAHVNAATFADLVARRFVALLAEKEHRS